MPRTSITSDLTTKAVNELQTGTVDTCIATGNTIKVRMSTGFEFNFSARLPGMGVVTGESKYSKEDCIASLARFIEETTILSSSVYNSWAKSPEQKELKTPNTHAIMITLGVWPANAIMKALRLGTINDLEVDEIIKMQVTINDKIKSLKPIVVKTDKVETVETTE